MIPRIIDIPFKRKSVFLFGPRQVGKSTLVKHLIADMDYLEIDLLLLFSHKLSLIITNNDLTGLISKITLSSTPPAGWRAGKMSA